jgi:nitrite reductase (NADH) small subunit
MTNAHARTDDDAGWRPVCALADIPPDTGACALVEGRQIAIVRVGEAGLYALDNRDPFSGAYVIARGIVGSAGGAPKIASPMYKQSFDLATGRCLDDPHVALAVYPVRVRAGRVELRLPDGG